MTDTHKLDQYIDMLEAASNRIADLVEQLAIVNKSCDIAESQLQAARDALKQVVNEGMYSMTAFNGDDDDELVVEISKSTILSAQQALAAGQNMAAGPFNQE